MEQNCNIIITLVLTAPNIANPTNTKFLLLEENDIVLPTVLMVGIRTSLLEYISQLLAQHTGLQAKINGVGWVELVPAPLYEELTPQERNVFVPFGGMIPETVELKSATAHWFTIAELMQNDKVRKTHLEVLRQTSLKI